MDNRLGSWSAFPAWGTLSQKVCLMTRRSKPSRVILISPPCLARSFYEKKKKLVPHQTILESITATAQKLLVRYIFCNPLWTKYRDVSINRLRIMSQWHWGGWWAYSGGPALQGLWCSTASIASLSGGNRNFAWGRGWNPQATLS